MDFSRLERAAIEAILSKAVDGMEAVREQFAATVLERDHTGVGFYTRISVPSSVPPMPNTKKLRDALFHGALARPTSDPEGWIIFHLWTTDGHLAQLEGVTVRDVWPDEDDIHDVYPCKMGKPAPASSEGPLIPDCDHRFALWRARTSARTLLVTALGALAIAMVVAIIAMAMIASSM